METTRFTAPHDYNKMIIIIVHMIFTKRRKHPGNCCTKWVFCFCGCWTPAKRIFFFFVHLCNFTEADWWVVAALQTGRELSCCSFSHIKDDTQFLESSVHQRSPHAAGGKRGDCGAFKMCLTTGTEWQAGEHCSSGRWETKASKDKTPRHQSRYMMG